MSTPDPCANVARHLRPALGGTTQRVLPTDWRLCMCVQSSGEEFMQDWGPEDVMRACMIYEWERGRDVWLVDPDGKKYQPIDTPPVTAFKVVNGATALNQDVPYGADIGQQTL